MSKKLIFGILIAITALLFNLNSFSTHLSILDFEEIEALACGENGCTKDYSRVDAQESPNGDGISLLCMGCGSLKCKVSK